MAYYGLLRVGELVSGNHHIKVVIHQGRIKDKLQIVLRSSKTHTIADQPQIIKIESVKRKKRKKTANLTDNPRHCLYKIVDAYIKSRDKYLSKNEPFFIFTGGIPVKPVTFIQNW